MNTLRLSPAMSAERRVIVEQTVSAERNRLFNFIKKRVSDPGDGITSWMFRVARNKIIDRYRKLKPTSFSEIEGVRAGDEAPLLLADIIGDTSSSPDDVYTRELIWESIEEVLAELPKSQREVFVWHELEDLSFREMSERTGDSINTLLSRKRYAVNYLRKRLQNLYNEI
jgi:RNA polymerase sigma factor (sigma-70 family)